MKAKFIVMDTTDNCATALEDVEQGEEVDYNGKKFKINQPIPLGHKFALKDIKKDNQVKKYGQRIAIATENIKLGDWIHTHNISSYYLKEVLNQ
ncbi:MAG: UxaA family hydrolase [Candidatus Lokiarchaeota archaeon]|nr:UxaA family hydrolase [Candidatus Lokiarchaeota archaeon]